MPGKGKRVWLHSHGYAMLGDSYVHRIVAEAWLGRRLREGEVVHHKDDDKLNNHPDNLEVFDTNSEHLVETHLQRFSPEDDWLLKYLRDRGVRAAEIANLLNIGLHAVNNRFRRLIREDPSVRLGAGWRRVERRSIRAALWALKDMGEMGISTRETLLDPRRNIGAHAVRLWDAA